MYFRKTTSGPVALAFTDRHGGVSRPPFDSFNLARVGADDVADVRRNHDLLVADFAPEATWHGMHQVHGADVGIAGPGAAAEDDAPACDALVSDRTGVVLMVRVADCVPVLLADPDAGVIGAAHAGRPGVAAGVVPAMVQAMRDLGAYDISAWIGPHICGGCYEVPESMRAEVSAIEPTTHVTTSWGTPGLDIGAGVRAQLTREAVTWVSWEECTMESPDLYSYRRDGDAAGRLAGVIWRQP